MNDSTREPPFGVLLATLWMSTAFFWMLLGALLLGALREQALSDMVSLGALSAAVFLLTAALLVARHPAGPSVRLALGLRPVVPLVIPLAFLGGILFQIPAEGIFSWQSAYLPGAAEAAQKRLELLLPHGTLHAIALLVVLSILVPFAEEAFFRGAVFGALRRSGQRSVRAALITGVGFTLSHFDLAMLLPIGLVAAFLGFLRARTGSLWPSIFGHVGFNLATMLPLALGANPAPTSSKLSAPVAFDVTSFEWQLGASLALAVIVAACHWLGVGEPARRNRRAETQVASAAGVGEADAGHG